MPLRKLDQSDKFLKIARVDAQSLQYCGAGSCYLLQEKILMKIRKILHRSLPIPNTFTFTRILISHPGLPGDEGLIYALYLC